VPLVISRRISPKTQMWTGVAVCILCVILGVWMIVLGKYLTAAFEFVPSFYGAMTAEITRRELRKGGD
jgi:hypothetical protein